MREPNLRMGLSGGFAVAVVSAAGAAGRSADALPTFALFFGAGMVPVLLVVALAAAIRRQSRRQSKLPPARW